MDEFVIQWSQKTAAMMVRVYGVNGGLVKTYKTPAGLQLDNYVASIHPNKKLHKIITNEKFCVEVYDDVGIIEKHHGEYIEDI